MLKEKLLSGDEGVGGVGAKNELPPKMQIPCKAIYVQFTLIKFIKA